MQSRRSSSTPSSPLLVARKFSSEAADAADWEFAVDACIEEYDSPSKRQNYLKSRISTLCAPDVSLLISAVRLTIACPFNDIAAVPSQPQPVVGESLSKRYSSFGLCNSPSRRKKFPAACAHIKKTLPQATIDLLKKEETEKLWGTFERLGLEDFDGSILFTHRVPEFWEVAEFLTELHGVTRYSPECFILAMIYLARVISNPYGFTLSSITWRPLLFSALLVAHKFWDDEYLTNMDFVTGYPNHNYIDANIAERSFLKLIDYDVGVKPSTYASAYFGCRTAARVFKELVTRTRQMYIYKEETHAQGSEWEQLYVKPEKSSVFRSSVSTIDSLSSNRISLTDQEAVEFGAQLLRVVEGRYIPKRIYSNTGSFCKKCYRCVCQECQPPPISGLDKQPEVTRNSGRKEDKKFGPLKKEDRRSDFAAWPKRLISKVFSLGSWKRSSLFNSVINLEGSFAQTRNSSNDNNKNSILSHRSVILSTLLPCKASDDSGSANSSSQASSSRAGLISSKKPLEESSITPVSVSKTSSSSSLELPVLKSQVVTKDTQKKCIIQMKSGGTLSSYEKNITMDILSSNAVVMVRRSISFDSMRALKRQLRLSHMGDLSSNSDLSVAEKSVTADSSSIETSSVSSNSVHSIMNPGNREQSSLVWTFTPPSRESSMILTSLQHGLTSELLALKTSELEHVKPS